MKNKCLAQFLEQTSVHITGFYVTFVKQFFNKLIYNNIRPNFVLYYKKDHNRS